MRMNFKSKSGFTLIELLVVIAIISLLSSIVFAALSSARSKARDAKRKEDLHSIRLALELYRDAYGIYPPIKANTSCGGADPWAESNGTCGGQWLTTDNNFYTFMPNIPVDPVNTGVNAGAAPTNFVYTYYQSLGGADYELLTQLENTNDKSACVVTPYYYHNGGNLPWCAPWIGNIGRNPYIFADH